MKKSALFISIFLILFFLPMMSSIELEIKSNFSQGETLLAKISGNFLQPLLKENVFFYRDGHVRIPLEYNIEKIQDEYYIYALLLNKNPYNNYSIVIKDIEYMKGNQISEEKISKTFSIIEKTADFSINPGVISTNNDFSVEVQNLNENKITIKINEKQKQQETPESQENSEESNEGFNFFGTGEAILNTPQDYTLKSGEIKEIYFNIDDIQQSTFQIIEFKTDNFEYELPVYIKTEDEIIQQSKSFLFKPSELNISVPTNSASKRIIYLENTGEQDLENISLSISESLQNYTNLSIKNIEDLEKNSSIRIELDFFSKEEKELYGNIKAELPGEYITIYFPIYTKFIQGYTPTQDEENPLEETCFELGGEICTKGEECDGESVYSKDGSCCLGSCQEIKKDNTGLIIGIILLILVAGFLVWFFFKKYKKTKKPVNLLKIAKGKENSQPHTLQHPRQIKETPLRREISQKPFNKIQKPKPIIRYIEKPIIKEKIIEKPVEKVIEKKIFVKPPKKPAPKKYKYKASTESDTYHKTSCRLAKLIKPKYKIFNDNPEFFEKKGYKPCKVCLAKKK